MWALIQNFILYQLLSMNFKLSFYFYIGIGPKFKMNELLIQIKPFKLVFFFIRMYNGFKNIMRVDSTGTMYLKIV